MQKITKVRGNIGMRIAICDDFAPFRDMMSQNVKNYDETIEVDVFEDGKYLLENFEAGKYDIILLDYYMDEMGGVQTSMEIRKIDQRVIIIFATTEGAVNMIAGDVFLKLEKPISQDRFNRTMEACVQRLNEDEKYITFHSDGIKRIIKKKNICFISNKGEVVTERFRLGSDEKIDLSDDADFFRTKNGEQIRIDKVERISWKTVEMWSGDKIDICFKEWNKLRKIRNAGSLEN